MQLHSQAAFKQLIMRGSLTIYNSVIMSFNRISSKCLLPEKCVINDVSVERHYEQKVTLVLYNKL